MKFAKLRRRIEAFDALKSVLGSQESSYGRIYFQAESAVMDLIRNSDYGRRAANARMQLISCMADASLEQGNLVERANGYLMSNGRIDAHPIRDRDGRIEAIKLYFFPNV